MKRFLVAVLMSGLFAAAAHAEGDAVLKASRGHVSVREASTGKWIRPQPGYVLNRNDQVITGRNGAVRVEFPNGATMLVKELSRFSFRVDRWGKIVSFRTGEFLVGLRNKLTGADRFRVKTPVAVAAIQGTVFWGKSDATAGSQFACFTGHVEVWAKGKNIVLQPGDKTSVAPQAQPAEITANDIPMTYAQKFAIDGDLAGIDQQITEESANPAAPAAPAEPAAPAYPGDGAQ